nr:hypothetical protein [Tanacetum cinerariifolium]
AKAADAIDLRQRKSKDYLTNLNAAFLNLKNAEEANLAACDWIISHGNESRGTWGCMGMLLYGQSNAVARRVDDDLIKLSGSTNVSKTCIGQFNAFIAKMKGMKDQGKVLDSLMALKDDRRDENNKLLGVNELIGEALEQIATKEGHLARIDGASSYGSCRRLVAESGAYYAIFLLVWLCDRCGVYGGECILSFKVSLEMRAFFILDKLTVVAESSCLPDKIKAVFVRARSEDESLAGLMQDLFFSLRISQSKKRRLVAKLEVMADRGDKWKSLEHMREIVAHDAMTLEDLEKLLARAQVRVSLKDGYVAERKRSRLS